MHWLPSIALEGILDQPKKTTIENFVVEETITVYVAENSE